MVPSIGQEDPQQHPNIDTHTLQHLPPPSTNHTGSPQETKSMIPESALVVVDGSEPQEREITGTKSVSPPRSSLPRPSLSVVEDDESEDVDEDYITRLGSSLEEAKEHRNSSNIRGRNSSRNNARNGLRNGESGSGLQCGKGGNMGVDEGGDQTTQSSEGSYSPAETGRRFYYRGDRSRTKVRTRKIAKGGQNPFRP